MDGASEKIVGSRPERMDGYIRVSRRMGREGPGYISKKIQRDAIQRWADYRGVEIVAWHEDEDESGGTQQRPGIREAMARVESGETDGIACWRLNRFARNVSEALDDVGTLHGKGGSLACVVEDIDPTGPFGEFVLVVLLAVAALELNNIKHGWRGAKSTAMERGAIIGPTPFGFRRIETGDHAGELEICEITGPVIRHAFAIASTRGLASTLEFLLEHGDGRAWTMSTVRRTLQRRCYVGEFSYGELSYKSDALAIVDGDTWVLAQPDEPKGRRPKADYPLSGLAECATCGTHMVGARGGRDRRTGEGLRTYRCAASLKTWKGARCPAPATTVAGPLEDLVREAVAAAADAQPEDVEDHGVLDDELAAASRGMREAERELEAASMDLTLRRVLGDRYHGHVQARVDAVEAAQAAYKRLAARRAAAATRVELGQLVRDAGTEELALLLRGILASVEVTRGRGPIVDRVRLVARDDDEAPPRVASVHDL